MSNRIPLSHSSLRRSVSVDFSKSVSRTKQSFKKDADINFIVSKAVRTGLLMDPVQAAARKQIFGDFASAPDFLTMQNRVASVTSAFEALPAEVRNRFNNSASELISFMADPANAEEAVSLGLAPKPKANVRYEDKDGNRVNRDGSPYVEPAPTPAPAPAPVSGVVPPPAG